MNMKMVSICMIILFIALNAFESQIKYKNRQLASVDVTETSSNYFFPKIADLGIYGYVVVWHNSSNAVSMQVFNPSGSKRGNNVLVCSGYNNQYPSVTGLGADFYVAVAYNSAPNSSYPYSIFIFWYDINSIPSYKTYTYLGVYLTIKWTAIKTLTNGYLVVGIAFDSNYLQFFMIRSDNLGVTVNWTCIKCNSYYTQRLEIAVLSNGNWVVVWDDNSNGNYDIFGKIFDNTGGLVKNDFNIHPTTSNDELYPSIASFSGGGFVVTWDRNINGYIHVRASIFYDNGVSYSLDFQVSTILNNSSYSLPSVATISSGFIVAFNISSPGESNIYVREYNSSNNPILNSETISTTITSGYQHLPFISKTSQEKYVLATVTPNCCIRLDKSSDFEFPTCQSFTQKINRDTTTLIDFVGKISSTFQSAATLRIVLKSLPDRGVLINSITNVNIFALIAYENYVFNYQPTLMTPTSFNYVSFDQNNRESSSTCVVTLNICYNSCLTCSQVGDSSSHSCTSCDSNYYPLSNNSSQCYSSSTIINGYFFNSNQFSPCPNNCNSCSSTSVCITCNTGYYLLNSDKKCYNPCPDGFFNNDANQTCTSCVNNCKSCSDQIKCNVCYSSYYWHYLVDFLCLTTCPDTFYNNNSITPRKCDSCPTNCKVCANSSDCTTCSTSYYLHESVDKKCYLKCPPGYFGNNSTNTCDACPSNCYSCNNSSTCTECNDKYFLYNNLCVSNCPDTYFNNISTKVCTSCTSNCRQCLDQIDCTICNSSYYVHYLINNQCYQVCPDGYFENTVDNVARCDECIANCKDCSNSTECTTCNSSYYLHYLNNKQCYYLECPPEYYVNKNDLRCEACSSNCYQCVDNTTCTICKDGFFLYNKICVSDCPDTYFNHVPSKTCRKCPNNCKKCYDENRCQICNDEFYLHLIDDQCYDICPVRYFANKITKACEKCPDNCLNCPDKDNCAICDTVYFLHYKIDNKCYSKCPISYYAETSNKKCESCSSNCDICINSQVCEKCGINYFLFSNYCYDECPASYYKNNDERRCDACFRSCYKCFNSEECIDCSPDFFLSDTAKTCYDECPNGYFANLDTRKCDRCPDNCITCSGPSNCIICENDYYLHLMNNQCYNNCPPGFFNNNLNKQCSPCKDKCLKCEDQNMCITCNDDYFLYPVDNTCLDSCPIQYFQNTQLKKCQDCPDNCDTCHNQQDCKICSKNYFLYTKTYKCLLECPDGSFKDLSSQGCVSCESTCTTCDGPSESNCLSCAIGMSLIDGKCKITCSNQEFFDPILKKCIKYEQLVTDFSLDAPNYIDLDLVEKLSLIIKVEFNEMFNFNPNDSFQILWEDSYGGELQQFNKTLVLDTKKLGVGFRSFSASLYVYNYPIKQLTKDIILRYFKLVPIIRNLTEFQNEQPIILDASLSYDERDTQSDPEIIERGPIEFQWVCPGLLAPICSKFTSPLLELSFEDYRPYSQDNKLTIKLKLILSRDIKKSSMDYIIKLSENTRKDNFFSIIQKTQGIKNEDLIFGIMFLSKKVKYEFKDFKYYWTIPGLSEESYMNTRKESSLRVKFENINNKVELIQLILTNIKTDFSYEKSYFYKAIVLPTGRCRVNPQKGRSGETLFTVYAENLKSPKLPLKFSFIYVNEFNIQISLKEFVSESFQSKLPQGNKFSLKISDSSGYITSIPCDVYVEKNEEIGKTKYEITSPEDKLIQYELYYSNLKKEEFSKGTELFKFKETLEYVNDLFQKYDKVADNHIEKIISYTNILNKCSNYFDDINNIQTFSNLLEKISYKSDIISKDRGLANIFLGVADSNLERFYSKDSSVNNTAILKQNNEIWDRMVNSIYSTMTDGEDVVLITSINRRTISKLSVINLSSIKLMTKNEENKNIFRFTNFYKTTSNPYNEKGDCGYSLEADFCLVKSLIADELKRYNQPEIGISIQVMDDPLIPNLSNFRTVMSFNTIKVSLVGITDKIDRFLQDIDSQDKNPFKYRVYLNLKSGTGQKDFETKVKSSTCIQYDKNYNLSESACNSWYDYKAKVVLCECTKDGLIANIYDEQLSQKSRSHQFSRNSHGFFNDYSLGVVLSMFSIVLIFFIIGVIRDNRDYKEGKIKLQKKYDMTQYLIVQFTKYGLGKNYGFWRLFFYMVRVTHPLLSIISIHSPFYSRGIRIFDLYNSINITFLFSIIPYYLTKNEDFEEIKTKRSISDIEKTPGNLSVALSKIMLSISYTIAATLASIIITNLLNAIYYENVIVNESNEKSKIMTIGLKRFFKANAYPYKNKFYKAAVRIKVNLMLVNMVTKMKDAKLNSNANLQPNQIKKIPKQQKKKSSLTKFCTEELKRIHYDIPKRYENKSKDSFFIPAQYFYENTEIEYIKQIPVQENLKITRFSENIKKSKFLNIFGKIKIFVTAISDRSYILRNQNGKKKVISSFCIQFIDKKSTRFIEKDTRVRSMLKIYAYIILFLSSWAFLFVMITDVYNKYEENMFKISISPLISVMLVKFLVTQNIMIFIYTLLMHLFGEKVYLRNRNSNDLLNLLFNYFIPAISQANHKAILTFNRLYNAIENSQE